MSADRRAVPAFLPEDVLNDLKHQARTREWADFYEPSSEQVFKRVQRVTDTRIFDLISKEMGRPVIVLGAVLRLNYKGELPNSAIHSDGEGYGKYVMVLHLGDNIPSGAGTAFWEHLETRKDRVSGSDYGTLMRIERDFNSPDQFVQTAVALASHNEALFYRSDLLHSRWPFEAYGTTPQDGRLSLSVFFT